MVLTIKGALQFATVVPGMLVHTKAYHIFPTLLDDLVKNIISAKKTHFGIFFRPPPDTKTTLITSAFLRVGIGQQHKGQAMA